MFFEISRQQDTSFTNSFHLVRDIWLNTDNGWSQFDIGVAKVYIKGYVEDRLIDINFINDIYQDTKPRYQGNYLAVIVKHDGTVIITHDIHRGTPLAYSTRKLKVTNLLDNGLEKVWADRIIKINPVGLVEVENYFDPYGDTTTVKQSRSQVLERLHQTIDNKIKNFLTHNQQTIKVFLSGGIDTITLFSFLKRHTDNYELCNYEHVDFTKIYCNKKHLIDQYWGYKQIHLWKDPSVLITGANGDENLMRSPATMTLILMHYGLKLEDVVTPECYHYGYLTADKLTPLYESQRSNPELIEDAKDYDSLVKRILNINLHDHQHWHYDHTLTYTPIKDLELCKIMLSLEQDDILDQIANAGISKDLVGMNDESLLEGLSNRKNQNMQENLWKIYEQYVNH